jgi:DNA replication and repair protein RecF
MRVSRLALADYRNYAAAEVVLPAGITLFIGRNGQGKTNLVEAIGYLATLSSHRVATDTALVRAGAERAVIRAELQRGGRTALLELEIPATGANRARLNRSPLPRTRELLGLLRTVLFAPEDLAIVKGDPDQRRRFLDELMTTRTPRLAGVRADYDRVLKQRNALLKSALGIRRGGGRIDLATLEVWDSQLARHGGELLAARVRLVAALRPLVEARYRSLIAADGEPEAGAAVTDLRYESGAGDLADDVDPTTAAELLAAALLARRTDELDRGITLVGPHRDDLALRLNGLPARGYASHGESWSMALALRLAAFDLLRADGDDPVLILDDVFAELDALRRTALAGAVRDAEQVLVTAAVDADVPADLSGHRLLVSAGTLADLP